MITKDSILRYIEKRIEHYESLGSAHLMGEMLHAGEYNSFMELRDLIVSENINISDEKCPFYKKGNVIIHSFTKAKECLGKDDVNNELAKEWELVCENPHEDEDFSYLCHREHCRCMQ